MGYTAFDPDPEYDDPEGMRAGWWTNDAGERNWGWNPPEMAVGLSGAEAAKAKSDAESMGLGELVTATQQAQARDSAPVPTAPQAVNPPTLPVPPAAAEPSDVQGINIPKSSRIAYVHNNPGNLKFAGQDGASQGEEAEDGGHWAAFTTPEEGLAALSRQIDIDAGKGATAKSFITKYAPPKSNDTATYIRQATEQLGVDENTPLSDIPKDKLVRFMAQKESGTQIGGDALPVTRSASPSAALPGAIPGQFGGMRPAMVEMRGAPQSPEQIQQRQQQVMDQTHQAMAMAQQAGQIRQQGRNDVIGFIEQQGQQRMADATAEQAKQNAIKTEAETNVKTAMAEQLAPGRLIQQMSAGDMVLGAIALIAGGVAQTLQQRGGQAGAKNMALERLYKALDDDLQQQKEDKHSRVAFWTKRLGDAESGMKAARAEQLNASAQLLQGKAMSVDNADIQAQTMQVVSDIQNRGLAEVQGITDREAERLTIKYAQPKTPKADPTKLVELLQASKTARQELELANYSPDQINAILAQHGLAPLQGNTVPQAKDAAGVERDQQKQEAAADVETSKDLIAIDEAEAKWKKALASVDALDKDSILPASVYTPSTEGGDIFDMLTPGMPGKKILDQFAQDINEGLNAQIRAEKGPQTEGDVERQRNELLGAGNLATIKRGIESKLQALDKQRQSIMGRRGQSGARVQQRNQANDLPEVQGRIGAERMGR